MASETQSGMHCAEFEALLSEALDGTLSGATRERFKAHSGACPACGPLFVEAEAGMRWLKSVVEVEPPANLIHNILAATTGVETRASVAGPAETSLAERARGWLTSVLRPAWGTVSQPRFAMSFAMVFCSFAIGLNVAGVKLSSVRNVDLRPSALRRAYYETSARAVKYYDNIRFVYEIESRVRELKRVTGPEETSEPAKEKNRKNDTTQTPDHHQNQNYSTYDTHPVLASSPSEYLNFAPAVPVIGSRRSA
jgi:hypothetical protein